MPVVGILGLARKFRRATQSGGIASALRKSVKGVASRSGLASQEEWEWRIAAIGAQTDQAISRLQDELSARLQEESNARLEQELSFRQRIDSIDEELAKAQTRLSAIENQQHTLLADFAEVRAMTVSVATDQAKVWSVLAPQSESIRWLAENHWTTGTLSPPLIDANEEPLVSVILPVWNREDLVGEAIESVQRQIYRNWELIIIDDGSTDKSAEKIAKFLKDPRIKYLPIPHQGVSVARNVGLAHSQGDLIAYADSDDIWYPAFLARMVAALAQAPDRDWAYAAKLFSDVSQVQQRIFHLPAQRASLMDFNKVPMTALVNRRSLYDRVGGFDETLKRLVDWDLVLRFSAISEPLVVPVMAGQHRMGSWPRITNQESHSFADYKVRQKHIVRDKKPVRVLYALQFFPQLSETFVTTEIAAMRERGVDITVWSEFDPPVPYETDVPVLHGDLREAVAEVRPNTVHTHSLHLALRYAPMVQPSGVPMTVRGHGFEYTEERLREVTRSNIVRAVFEFPHFMPANRVDGVDTTKLREITACFNPNLYFPEGTADPHLVVRAGLASPTKSMDAFIRIAAMCPRHRFVLAACWSVGYPDHLEQLHALNRSLGEPVEILKNYPLAETAELIQRAGIFLHTHSLEEPYGMPVSIAEAMAAGCYVIARGCPASVAYVAEAGKTYDTEAEAAALVLETERWTSEQWAAARLASIDRAFTRYPADQVLQPLLNEWNNLSLASRAATA